MTLDERDQGGSYESRERDQISDGKSRGGDEDEGGVVAISKSRDCATIDPVTY